ncbi:MAG: hypothetical protein H7249_19075 [Chitinophagaceae bacterium]|nr:hypothetical protein [Oligoflexus sp.]
MKKTVSNDEILAMEERGESLEGVVKGTGRMMAAKVRPSEVPEKIRNISRVNVDFPIEMLRTLDEVGERLMINRQALIKEAVMQLIAKKIDEFSKQEIFMSNKR